MLDQLVQEKLLPHHLIFIFKRETIKAGIMIFGGFLAQNVFAQGFLQLEIENSILSCFHFQFLER